MNKTLDTKLAALSKDKSSKDFIICYAADPDLAAGILAMMGQFATLGAYRDHMDALVRDAKLDIMLTSPSTMGELAHQRRLFDDSPVTPAARANDTTDNWHVRHGNYDTSLSRPFSSATLDEIRYGTLSPAADAKKTVNLGLYSITFNNDVESDLRTLERIREFRIAAAAEGFRYFVEIFNPSAPLGLDAGQIPDYVNDCITRMLAGMTDSAPEFLKLTYNGPKAMEDLVAYTPSIVGVLGGSPSTTLDAFTLLTKAKHHGARVALFGRRIQVTEDPISFVRCLREVADDNMSAEEGVKAYHGALQEAGIKPQRSLADDMVIVTPELKL